MDKIKAWLWHILPQIGLLALVGLIAVCVNFAINIQALIADYWYYTSIIIYVVGIFVNVRTNTQQPSYMPFATPPIERYLYNKIGNWTMILLKLLSFTILVIMAFGLSMYSDYTIEEMIMIFFFISGVAFVYITYGNLKDKRSWYKKFDGSENERCKVCKNTIKGDAAKLKWTNKWNEKVEEIDTYLHYDCFIKSKPISIDGF